MKPQSTQISHDTITGSDMKPAPVRKSNMLLHTRSGISRDDSSQNPNQTAVTHNKISTGTTSPELLRERLSRMFDKNVQPRQRRSVDVPALKSGHKIEGGSTGVHNLPPRQIPHRKSSLVLSRQTSLQDFPSWRLPPANAAGKLILDRGRAESPVRKSIVKDSISSDTVRSSPSRTFVRPSPPLLLLQNGSIHSKRIELSTDLNAPIFVGGGTIEGKVNIDIDRMHHDRKRKKDLFVSKLSVDVVGYESVDGGRTWVFLALASELFDEKHPPPPTIATSQQPTTDPELFWKTRPGRASIPFCINLPLNVGPPPYSSRNASIRYALLATLVMKNEFKKAVVSRICEVHMHTVYDPYKALASLPSPIVAADSLILTNLPGPQSVQLSAGLHRQIWVSGNSIFVDVHIVNKSDRCLKKLEVELQRSSLWYDHAAAGTGEKNASHLRIPKRQDSEIVSATTARKSEQWKGVLPRTSEVRTCQIDVPRGQVTISTGRFFEVRYFLNVIVTVSILKNVTVQLPVTLIHMNSLDIVPNALAQVAASIEAKRSKTLPLKDDNVVYLPYHQGQAFIASRNHSLEQSRGRDDKSLDKDLEDLERDLDDSPRRYQHHHHNCRSQLADATNVGSRPNMASSAGQHELDPDCYHCHLIHENNRRPSTSHSRRGGNLPRLPVSTSGLGFSDTEFSVRNSPPKKVMLSERERKMINQQRELENRQEWHRRKEIELEKADLNASKRTIFPLPPSGMTAAHRLRDQMRRAEPHIMTKSELNRKRSRTLDAPPQAQVSTISRATIQPQATLKPVDPNVNIALPGNTRRRAHTGGPDSLSKPPLGTSVDRLQKGVTFLQDNRSPQRMSNKQRGKLPAQDFVFPDTPKSSR